MIHLPEDRMDALIRRAPPATLDFGFHDCLHPVYENAAAAESILTIANAAASDAVPITAPVM